MENKRKNQKDGLEILPCLSVDSQTIGLFRHAVGVSQVSSHHE